MMINIKDKITSIFVMLLIIISPMAYSQGVGLDATRIIYPADAKSVGIVVRNQEPKINYLVQAYITSNEHPITFEVTPPIFRLNSESKHEVKIYSMANTLPKDRESVFYFHAKMIPGQESKEKNLGMNIGFDNMIKLFYRPKNLSMTSEEAQKGLKFAIEGKKINIANNSPYFISFADVTVNGTELDISLSKNNAMIAPYSSINYPLPVSALHGNIHWRTINDLGGLNEFTSKF